MGARVSMNAESIALKTHYISIEYQRLIMKMRDLLELKFNKNTDKIDIEEIIRALPNTPISVAEQFYQDHGRKAEFQNQYANIDLEMLVWPEIAVPGGLLIDYSMSSKFSNWNNDVRQRLTRFPEIKWACIDVRQDVIRYWEENLTWKTSPILINGAIIGSHNRFHLIEGHTRLGILSGALKHEVISPDICHKAYVGNY